MCGIIGYVGYRDAQPILIEGLKRMEYRGYDSAGIALMQNGSTQICKTPGRISALENKLDWNGQPSHIGIAHTRWATHGAPNEINAHPHADSTGRISLVHNGIIENHDTLRTFLERKEIHCISETDTEVLAQLIAYFYKGDLEKAVRAALNDVQGTYGIAVMCTDEPGVLVAARMGSPLILGVGKNENLIASDAAALLAHTSQVIYLSDGEIARVTPEEFRTTTLDAIPVTKDVEEIEWTLEEIELGGYEHFMAKEIFEQPEALRNCLRGRLDEQHGAITLGGITKYTRELVRARRFILTACGTAYHAGLLGEYFFEDVARVPCETEYASEFRYRNPIIDDGTVVIAISQSGETIDTLAALREAKMKGALALGIVNVVGSTISRETDAGIYLHVGPEIGVASTKAFIGQFAILTLVGIFLGRRHHLSQPAAHELLKALARIPDQMSEVLAMSDQVRLVAERYQHANNWLYLGRGYNYPVAIEGALKIKEISYVHAEGMPAAEMKHGPIALITEGMPVVFIATHGNQYEKILGNINEVRARGGHIIAVATAGDRKVADLADQVFYVPDCPEPLQPLLTIIPLQLLAYHMAVLRGCNVDKPRNLAKSVTVE
ncbi:MAG: Glutamine--fructose-6-phosphate aminotransferase [isomerizing] [Phycisphaerae bacterium]|nr:Glutamine--fructose-6-phosphate aminotransferase [isomerizing] [Phycisphaerae bacterium]